VDTPYDDEGHPISLTNVIITNNLGDICMHAVNDNGNNLVQDDSCALTHPSSLEGVTTSLAPLVNNGGLTKTMALPDGSIAIDRGSNSDCPWVDQRGIFRPIDGDLDGIATCDVGAFEKQSTYFAPTPNPVPGSGSGPILTMPIPCGMSVFPYCFERIETVPVIPDLPDQMIDCLVDGPGCWNDLRFNWPTTQTLLDLTIASTGKLLVELLDSEGSLVATAQAKIVEGEENVQTIHYSINQPLPAGLYFVSIKNIKEPYSIIAVPLKQYPLEQY
jgi:hypothetical protein